MVGGFFKGHQVEKQTIGLSKMFLNLFYYSHLQEHLASSFDYEASQSFKYSLCHLADMNS